MTSLRLSGFSDLLSIALVWPSCRFCLAYNCAVAICLFSASHRSTVDQVGDVLKEVLFSAINKSGKSPKKLCPERIHSFAEDTPVDRLHCYHQRSDPVTSVIIPDSLVTETVSLIPETIRATSSSYEKPEPRDRRLASDSFEAFLDEVM